MTRTAIRVLCVDDEQFLLSALERALHGKCETRTTTCPAHALRILEEDASIGVVICDLSMPVTNGIELLGKVRTRWPHIVRVLLSGHGANCLPPEDRSLAHACLAKPFPAEQLESVVKHALESSPPAAVCA